MRQRSMPWKIVAGTRPASVSLLVLALGFAVTLAGVGPAFAQAADKPGAPDTDAMMAEYLRLSQPGEHHKYLDHLAGSWSFNIKMWNPAGGDPTESPGEIEASWVLGGRFLKSDFTGTVMGMPFQGLSYDGYDNVEKKYVATWVDNFGTGIQTFEGQVSDGGKVRTMSSETRDPMSGEMLRTKGVTTILNDDSYKYEAYVIMPDGSEFKQMEVVARRRS